MTQQSALDWACALREIASALDVDAGAYLDCETEAPKGTLRRIGRNLHTVSAQLRQLARALPVQTQAPSATPYTVPRCRTCGSADVEVRS